MYVYDTPFSLDNGAGIDAKDFRYKVKALWTYVDKILFTKFFDLQRTFIVVAKMKKWMHNNLKIFASFLFFIRSENANGFNIYSQQLCVEGVDFFQLCNFFPYSDTIF